MSLVASTSTLAKASFFSAVFSEASFSKMGAMALQGGHLVLCEDAHMWSQAVN